MAESFDITTIAQLRAVIGEEIPGLSDKNVDYLDSYAQEFIAKAPFMVLATADAQGNLDASPKGDAPGFVCVQDEKTLLVPDRPGNKLAYGHLNILQNSKVGLIFIIPATSETLRVNGTATLTAAPDVLDQLAAREKPATLAMRVNVEEVFFHCGKAFIRSNLWRHEQWPEKHKVSFGKMIAEQKGADTKFADAIDASIEQDYKNNL